MSDYEHIRGTLKTTNKSIDEYLGNVVLESYHSDKKEYFEDVFYRKAFEINGIVYEVESKEINPYDDIYNASLNENGNIDFELKYYNGGCSFNEALEAALEKLENKDEA